MVGLAWWDADWGACSVSDDKLVRIDGIGTPPREARRFSAAAIIFRHVVSGCGKGRGLRADPLRISWLPEVITTAISPPHR